MKKKSTVECLGTEKVVLEVTILCKAARCSLAEVIFLAEVEESLISMKT